MICPNCKKEALWCENKEIYGRNYGNSYMMWLCKPCDMYVGCHQNTKRSLGIMADKETRELKKEVKRMYLSKYEKYGKKWMYRKLSEDLNITAQEAHFGMFDKERLLKLKGILIN